MTIEELIERDCMDIASMQKYGSDIQEERRKILECLWNLYRIFNALPENIKKLEVYDHD